MSNRYRYLVIDLLCIWNINEISSYICLNYLIYFCIIAARPVYVLIQKVFNKTEFVPIYPQVKEDYPHLVGPNTCVSRKLGFPDVIMPGQKSIRHSFCSLSFIRISIFLSMYHYYQSFIQSVLCHWLQEYHVRFISTIKQSFNPLYHSLRLSYSCTFISTAKHHIIHSTFMSFTGIIIFFLINSFHVYH